MQPDLDGFREAQQRLITQMAESVVLLTPVTGLYPDGTKLDPETGKPLNPWVRAASAGFASATARASVVYRPITGGGTASNAETALGIKGTMAAAVVMTETDYVDSEGEDATEVLFANRRYRIEDRVFDPMPNHRILYIEPL